MKIHFHPLPQNTVAALRRSGLDDYGIPVEHHISDGSGLPCRCCLHNISAGMPYLILAHRPFDQVNPYTETGPIFLCEACETAAPSEDMPEILESQSYLLRGYCSDERIVYGTGAVVAQQDIVGRAKQLFEDDNVAFVDLRSASNNCFQCRIKRA